MCTGERYRILGGNDRLTGFEARNINKSYGVSIEFFEIIADYETKHARECVPKYLKRLQAKYERVGVSFEQQVHEIVQKV